MWTQDGAIAIVNWDGLIEALEVGDRLRLALECAFRRSEYLYDQRFQIMFRDAEIRQVIEHKFEDLSKVPIDVPLNLLERFTVSKVDTPFPFPHSDTATYAGTLYAGGTEGVEFANLYENHIQQTGDKLTDIPALSIAAGSARLAISAGSEGVHQTDIYPTPTRRLSKVLQQHSTLVRWVQICLFSSSIVAGGYFADFVTRRRKRDDPEDTPRERVLRELLPANELFGRDTQTHSSRGFVWGSDDRLCFATDTYVEVVRFFPRRRRNERFEKVGRIESAFEVKGRIIAGDSGVFGFVIEYENGLAVIDSTLNRRWMPGEPVNWRVFPRSRYYTNQLHIVREDHVSVLSFNDDYFVDQKSKLSGIQFRPPYKPRSDIWTTELPVVENEVLRPRARLIDLDEE